jgi:acetyl-CoA carboxylase biotin carboxylase subunit
LFNKILIANRGEIAVRIIKACKELGIKAAAIYSDIDITSMHSKLADESYHIGSSDVSDSYLNKNKIIELAKRISADAIHPGYGFFAENASFIEDVERAGITFIGPSSRSVKMIGSKTSARALMKKSNVPIVPGGTEPIGSIKEGLDYAKEIGFPILLKASAGGGGKGMRKVSSAEEFEAAFESTKREALKAFANDDIYIEKFIEKPKHIEVQIISDKFGNFRHIFERECSIQRRHQKIIEEAPSSFVDEATREKLVTSAINAARACDYFNAGTIEFLMDQNKNFYFLEMNTRIQVEHPVTELISGIDLVREQISIAAGNKISFMQEDISIKGFALECRIYAEDSANNFLPSSGKLLKYVEPNGPGVRVDSGFSENSEISIYYDPMIAKLICWDKDRASSILRMKRALAEYIIAGIVTNKDFLYHILDHPKFIKGDYDINFIDTMDLTEVDFKEKQLNDIEDSSALFAALMKDKKSSVSVKKNVNNYSKWWDLNHE